MKLFFLLFAPLFGWSQTAISNKTVAVNFLNALNSSQKTKCQFPFDQLTRYNWHYVPADQSPRQGIAIKDLDSLQKRKAYTLLKNFLSDKGYQKTLDIMQLEYVLKALEPTNPSRIPENYFIAIYGNPAKDSVWGWKFGGHHMALNFTIVDNQLAFAPFFFGSNPGQIKEGPDKGKKVLKDEEDLGFELINALTKEQQTKAIFRTTAFADNVTTNVRTVSALEPVGIAAQELNAAQKILLDKLIKTYLSSMPTKVAEIRMRRIKTEDMQAIRFGWAGALVAGQPHYYRIQGETFLIEFDNTQNNANHMHTVWRDFNGDFGEDLLKEHYHTDHQH